MLLGDLSLLVALLLLIVSRLWWLEETRRLLLFNLDIVVVQCIGIDISFIGYIAVLLSLLVVFDEAFICQEFQIRPRQHLINEHGPHILASIVTITLLAVMILLMDYLIIHLPLLAMIVAGRRNDLLFLNCLTTFLFYSLWLCCHVSTHSNLVLLR